ncbi:hypothetical protein [Roseobacter phage RDJL3]|nr:hypothetical protein [Roseobacter phage RDJL3]
MQGVLLPSGHSEQMRPCPDCDGTGRIEIAEPELPITRKATVKSYPNCSKVLADVLEGKEVLAAKTWDYLKPLTTKGAGSFDTHEFNAPAEVEMHVTDDDLANFGGFEKESVAKVFPLRSKVVGNSYRDGVQVSAFRNKNPGNRVLLVPEPGNPHDEYALAVVVAKGTSQSSFVWTHAGYVPRAQAKELARIWPRYRGRLLVGEGRLVGHPGKEQSPEIVIEGSFRNYFPDE